jgi:ABC transporter substrate binding protein (PQQ-dependent alcohol dehydrogenase system)
MTGVDYTHYVAVIALAQGLQKNTQLTVAQMADYLRSSDFSLAAYKGRKLSFRPKNGQLRMPLSLFHARGVVSQSPQTGFMHPVTELDTLGLTPNEICQ